VTIGLKWILQRARLTWCAGEALPWSQQKSGLDLKETGFDRAGARAADIMPLVATVAGLFRACPSKACGQP
jgi:hypothetical protein